MKGYKTALGEGSIYVCVPASLCDEAPRPVYARGVKLDELRVLQGDA